MKILTTLCCFCILNITVAQVGINTESPDPSSILDISAPDKGILLPRVDIADVNTEAPVDRPATGLVVWNTAQSNSSVSQGLYFWDGTKWVRLTTLNDLQNNGGGNNSTSWSKNGDYVQEGEYIGSNNYQSFVIKTNGQEVARFDPQNGAVSMGYDSQANKNRSIALGSESQAAHNDGVAIGTNTYTDFKSIAIGHNANASGNTGISLGRESEAISFESNAIGRRAQSNAQGATALGNHAIATQQESIILGDYRDLRAKVGIGTTSPTEKLQVNGHLRMVDGNQGELKVLMSENDGTAYWKDLNTLKAVGQILKNNTTSLNQNNYVSFGNTVFNSNVTTRNDGFQTLNFTGIYRVSYTLALSKWRGGPVGVKFFLAKNNSSSNLVEGSETFIEVDNNDKVTVRGECYLELEPFEILGIMSDITNQNVKIHAEGTSMGIELIKRIL